MWKDSPKEVLSETIFFVFEPRGYSYYKVIVKDFQRRHGKFEQM